MAAVQRSHRPKASGTSRSGDKSSGGQAATANGNIRAALRPGDAVGQGLMQVGHGGQGIWSAKEAFTSIVPSFFPIFRTLNEFRMVHSK